MRDPWSTSLAACRPAWRTGLVAMVALSAAAVAPGAAGVAGAATPNGHSLVQPASENFWLATATGSLYGFGVPSYGSPAAPLNRPLVGVTATRDQQGYWLVASDGGVFTFGDAHFYRPTASDPGDPVERLVPTHSGNGYWVVQQNGTATAFGDAASSTPPTQALLFDPVTPGDRAVQFAFQQLGKPFIWGGNGPVGYDCSGLALASWSHTSGITFARGADDQFHTAGTAVPMTDLQTGDLVFWVQPDRLDDRVPHGPVRGREPDRRGHGGPRPAQRPRPVGHGRPDARGPPALSRPASDAGSGTGPGFRPARVHRSPGDHPGRGRRRR